LSRFSAVLLLVSVVNAYAQSTGVCSTVTSTQSFTGWWSCAYPPLCAGDYNSFPDRARKYRQPITDAQLTNQLNAMRAEQVKILTETPATGLRSALLDALNMRFLVDGLPLIPTKVTLIRDQVYPYPNSTQGLYRERQLLFSDPYIGTFKGILLTPAASAGGTLAPYPVVLALHGHAETAEKYRDLYFAREYPKTGIGILVITSRVMDPWLGEHSVSKKLLLNGFTLMGLHAYEGLIALKYLACHPEVKPGKLGLIGHSGGSSAGNLLVRIAPERVAAYVSDFTIDYSMLDIPEPYHCETIPRVYPYHRLINDFRTSTVPVLPVGYEYKRPDGTSATSDIITFFESRLKN
jgi:hypothetical protein